MKHLVLALAICTYTANLHAQTDTSRQPNTDTIRVGNLIIVGGKSNPHNEYKVDRSKTDIKIMGSSDTLVSITDDTVKVGRLKIINKQEGNYNKDWESLLGGDFKKTKISFEKSPKKLKEVSTNWWIVDLGFANYQDRTPTLMHIANPASTTPHYVAAQDLTLNNIKSSNVNLWIVQQKVNLYHHKLNLKYGVGFEMFNFRFEKPVSFRENNSTDMFLDSISFSKNKLFVKYLTIPLQLNFHPHPENRKSFYASIGVSAGYLVKAKNKQISDERGKQKITGNFNLNDWRFATIGELGIGSIRLYGSYGFSNLFDKNQTSFDMQPYALGIRFSHF